MENIKNQEKTNNIILPPHLEEGLEEYIDINSKEYLEEREAVKRTMEKMKKELKKPHIRAVFERLKDK